MNDTPMEQKIHRIYETAVEILERAGIRLFHPETIDLLNDKGIRISGDTAYFTAAQIRD